MFLKSFRGLPWQIFCIFEGETLGNITTYPIMDGIRLIVFQQHAGNHWKPSWFVLKGKLFNLNGRAQINSPFGMYKNRTFGSFSWTYQIQIKTGVHQFQFWRIESEASLWHPTQVSDLVSAHYPRPAAGTSLGFPWGKIHRLKQMHDDMVVILKNPLQNQGCRFVP